MIALLTEKEAAALFIHGRLPLIFLKAASQILLLTYLLPVVIIIF